MLVLGSVNKVKLRATASTWHPGTQLPHSWSFVGPSGADAILAPRHAWLPNIGSQKLQKGDISNWILRGFGSLWVFVSLRHDMLELGTLDIGRLKMRDTRDSWISFQSSLVEVRRPSHHIQEQLDDAPPVAGRQLGGREPWWECQRDIRLPCCWWFRNPTSTSWGFYTSQVVGLGISEPSNVGIWMARLGSKLQNLTWLAKRDLLGGRLKQAI